MTLTEWAARHAIPPAALQDLQRILCLDAPPDPVVDNLTSEAAVQQQVRLRVAQVGGRVFRNNVGTAVDPKTGRPVRFGLANDSKQMNDVFKSSDLIGIVPVTCPCGHKYGVFGAFEIKRPGWRLTPGDKRGQAQQAFIQFVIGMGGIARFVTRVEDL